MTSFPVVMLGNSGHEAKCFGRDCTSYHPQEHHPHPPPPPVGLRTLTELLERLAVSQGSGASAGLFANRSDGYCNRTSTENVAACLNTVGSFDTQYTLNASSLFPVVFARTAHRHTIFEGELKTRGGTLRYMLSSKRDWALGRNTGTTWNYSSR